jgi:para-aminobenzoate synthetase
MEEAFSSLFSESPHAFWLDSSLVERGRARWSYAGDASGPNAARLQYRSSDKRLEISDHTGAHVKNTGIFEYLEQIEPSQRRNGRGGFRFRNEDVRESAQHRRAGARD